MRGEFTITFIQQVPGNVGGATPDASQIARACVAERPRRVFAGSKRIPEVQTVVSLMRGQSAAWTDRRIRPTVHERNITAGQFVPFDVCHAFLARRSTSRRHCHHFAHIRVEYEHRLG